MAKGRRNQAKAAAQANKARRVAKRAAPAPAPKPAPRPAPAPSRPAPAPSRPAPQSSRSSGAPASSAPRTPGRESLPAPKQETNAERRARRGVVAKFKNVNKPAATTTNKVEQRLGQEQYKNVSQSGLQNPTNNGRYDANEVISEFRNRAKGVSVDEGDNSVLARFKKAQAEGATFNKKAQKYLERYGMNFNTGGQSSPPKQDVKIPETITEPFKPEQVQPNKEPINQVINPSTQPGTSTGTTNQTQNVNQDNDQTSTIVGDNNNVTQNQDNSIDQMGGSNGSTVGGGTSGSAEEADSLKNSYVEAISNVQKQDVNQDNDQTSTITGDNNTVWQNQDNSIRQYGGDNRSFVYNGGSDNKYEDTPVSAATMGGFYDVDDSPAAQAKFVDMHTTMNRDNQKRYAGMGMKTAGMFKGFDARSFDPSVLQSRIDQSTQRSFDQATVKDNDLFGDRDLYRGLLSGYKFGKPPKEIKYESKDDDDD